VYHNKQQQQQQQQAQTSQQSPLVVADRQQPSSSSSSSSSASSSITAAYYRANLMHCVLVLWQVLQPIEAGKPPALLLDPTFQPSCIPAAGLPAALLQQLPAAEAALAAAPGLAKRPLIWDQQYWCPVETPLWRQQLQSMLEAAQYTSVRLQLGIVCEVMDPHTWEQPAVQQLLRSKDVLHMLLCRVATATLQRYVSTGGGSAVQLSDVAVASAAAAAAGLMVTSPQQQQQQQQRSETGKKKQQKQQQQQSQGPRMPAWHRALMTQLNMHPDSYVPVMGAFHCVLLGKTISDHDFQLVMSAYMSALIRHRDLLAAAQPGLQLETHSNAPASTVWNNNSSSSSVTANVLESTSSSSVTVGGVECSGSSATTRAQQQQQQQQQQADSSQPAPISSIVPEQVRLPLLLTLIEAQLLQPTTNMLYRSSLCMVHLFNHDFLHTHWESPAAAAAAGPSIATANAVAAPLLLLLAPAVRHASKQWAAAAAKQAAAAGALRRLPQEACVHKPFDATATDIQERFGMLLHLVVLGGEAPRWQHALLLLTAVTIAWRAAHAR
jgi:hypothetical protein